MNKVLLLGASCLALLIGSARGEVLPDATIKQLQTLYLSRLDGWVKDGGKQETLQEQVVGSCGKMMYLHTDMSAIPKLTKEQRDEMDMRIDVCSKLTITRVYPQPEFSDPKIVKIVCVDYPKEEPMIGTLCSAAKINAPAP